MLSSNKKLEDENQYEFQSAVSDIIRASGRDCRSVRKSVKRGWHAMKL